MVTTSTTISVVTDDNKEHVYRYVGMINKLGTTVRSIGSEGFLISDGLTGMYYPPHRIIRVTVSAESAVLPVMDVTSRKLGSF